MLCDIVGVPELKEDSTAYVSAWVKRHIWGLPVEVPYVPKFRRLGFAVYALLSGAYSYFVLFIAARFVGNIFRNFNPEWSFIPEIGTAFLIFKSRLRTLVNFMKFVYLDKKDRVRAMTSSWRTGALAIGILVLIVPPWWHETASGRFVVEPATKAIVRAKVPGKITEVFVTEGMEVSAGSRLLLLSNQRLQSRVEENKLDFSVASMRANSASLHYTDSGPAMAERNRLIQQSRQLESQASALELTSPISGVLLTARLGDRVGSYVPAGTQLAEIANLRIMRARIYISDHEMGELSVGATARLQVVGQPTMLDASVMSIAPVSSEIAPELSEKSKYVGLNPLNFYVVDLLIPNPGLRLNPGIVGFARIMVTGEAWRDSFGRK